VVDLDLPTSKQTLGPVPGSLRFQLGGGQTRNEIFWNVSVFVSCSRVSCYDLFAFISPGCDSCLWSLSVLLDCMFKNKKTETLPVSMPPSQQELLEKLGANLETGLTSDQASQRREQDGAFNVVRPPVDCPAWLCIILPCIKHVPSMKAFAAIKPDDAEILRNGKWVRYDASSLVKGDVIRLEEGDVVPGDCAILQVSGDEELLVDLRCVTGEERLKTVASGSDGLATLYYGGKVVQGSALAVITAIGPNTLLANLISEKQFPPTEPVLEAQDETRLNSIV
jgi:hypothetical protein